MLRVLGLSRPQPGTFDLSVLVMPIPSLDLIHTIARNHELPAPVFNNCHFKLDEPHSLMIAISRHASQCYRPKRYGETYLGIVTPAFSHA